MQPQDESIGALLEWAAGWLSQAGIEAPRREAILLLAHALGLPAGSMRLRQRSARLSPEAGASFCGAVARRAARTPLAYITGRQGFWTLDLDVSDATLIPRADSEALIEALLVQRPDRGRPLRMLDLGTGTGCLLLAALSEYPNSTGVGVDISPAACALAAWNASRHGLAARSAFLCGNWSDPVCCAARFDLVLSNPPYIREAALAGLMPEVARFEPAAALDGGADGLRAYRAILQRLPALLRADGAAILELGAGQLAEVQAIASASGLAEVAVQPDLGGIARAIMLRPA